jgi:hypothetical protein
MTPLDLPDRPVSIAINGRRSPPLTYQRHIKVPGTRRDEMEAHMTSGSPFAGIVPVDVDRWQTNHLNHMCWKRPEEATLRSVGQCRVHQHQQGSYLYKTSQPATTRPFPNPTGAIVLDLASQIADEFLLDATARHSSSSSIAQQLPRRHETLEPAGPFDHGRGRGRVFRKPGSLAVPSRFALVGAAIPKPWTPSRR